MSQCVGMKLLCTNVRGKAGREDVDTITVVVMSCLQTNGGSKGGRPSCSILKCKTSV